MNKKVVLFLSVILLFSGFFSTTLSASQPQKKGKPFLIQRGLPHLTMMVKALWDDEDLALTKAQKEKLLKIRKITISGAKSLAQNIFALEDKIIKDSVNLKNPKEMEHDVEKLASLRAKATMIHLNCIYETRKVLTKDQLYILE